MIIIIIVIIIIIIIIIIITHGSPNLGQKTRPYNNQQKKSIIENGQNTDKSPGDLRRLAVTQTPVKNHQLTLK